jgi:WD40 repeat protein
MIVVLLKLSFLQTAAYQQRSALAVQLDCADIHSKKQIGILKGCASTIRKVVFSPDGQYLATIAAGCTIKLWKAGSGIEIHEF